MRAEPGLLSLIPYPHRFLKSQKNKSTSQAIDLIDTAFHSLGNRLGGTRLQAHFAIDTYRDDHDKAKKVVSEAKKRKRPVGTPFYIKWVAVPAYDLTASRTFTMPIGAAETLDADIIAATSEALRARLRWLFVAAYESYETYICSVYAIVGFLNPGSWPSKHRDDLSIPKANQKWLAWFRRRASRVKRESLQKLLHALDVPVQFSAIEGCNYRYENMRCSIMVAAQLRHFIVHSEGRTSEAKFWQAVGRDLGTCVKGKPDVAEVIRVKYRGNFRGRRTAREITFAETVVRSETPRARGFEGWLELLGSHAALIYSLALACYGENPRWNRPPVTVAAT